MNHYTTEDLAVLLQTLQLSQSSWTYASPSGSLKISFITSFSQSDIHPYLITFHFCLIQSHLHLSLTINFHKYIRAYKSPRAGSNLAVSGLRRGATNIAPAQKAWPLPTSTHIHVWESTKILVIDLEVTWSQEYLCQWGPGQLINHSGNSNYTLHCTLTLSIDKSLFSWPQLTELVHISRHQNQHIACYINLHIRNRLQDLRQKM
jgi:hypothetical protein